MNISGLLHININCRDFERSRQFYEMLGFAGDHAGAFRRER
jgi:catechol 2,3-dioxygenase-like lactoylglutathione lyase family enzyme